MLAPGQYAISLIGMLLCADLSELVPASADPSTYFEGRWAFIEETCDMPSNWTMLKGGNFVSENLTGTWEWDDAQKKLRLHLTDLAIDEETGEAGDRFQLEGSIGSQDESGFVMVVEPERYTLKRCPLSE